MKSSYQNESGEAKDLPGNVMLAVTAPTSKLISYQHCEFSCLSEHNPFEI